MIHGDGWRVGRSARLARPMIRTGWPRRTIRTGSRMIQRTGSRMIQRTAGVSDDPRRRLARRTIRTAGASDDPHGLAASDDPHGLAASLYPTANDPRRRLACRTIRTGWRRSSARLATIQRTGSRMIQARLAASLTRPMIHGDGWRVALSDGERSTATAGVSDDPHGLATIQRTAGRVAKMFHK